MAGVWHKYVLRSYSHKVCFKRRICAKCTGVQSSKVSNTAEERITYKITFFPISLSWGWIWVTWVQAGLCGCAGPAGVCRACVVQRLCAPPQALQWLQEGSSGSLLLQRRSPFLFHLCNLCKGYRLGLEAGFPRSSGATAALGWALGHRELLRELLHGRCQYVGWKHGVTHRLQWTCSHGWRCQTLCVRLFRCGRCSCAFTPLVFL